MADLNFAKRVERLSHYRDILVPLIEVHIVSSVERRRVIEMLDLLLTQSVDHGRLCGLEVVDMALDDSVNSNRKFGPADPVPPHVASPAEDHTQPSSDSPSAEDSRPDSPHPENQREGDQTKSSVLRSLWSARNVVLKPLAALLVLVILSLTVWLRTVHYDFRPIYFYLTHSETSRCSDLPPDLVPLYEKCRVPVK